MRNYDFSKLAFRIDETAVLDAQGSQILPRMSEKRGRKNDVILYSSLVDFCSVLGGILGPKIDQKSISKSIEFRSRFWEAFLRVHVRVRRAQVGGRRVSEVGAGGRGGDPGTRKSLAKR